MHQILLAVAFRLHSQTMYAAACRYIRYHADVVQFGGPAMHQTRLAVAFRQHSQTIYTAACRYVRYYADTVHHGQPKVKLLQLRRVVVVGLSDDDLNDIIVTVKLRPGAGWDTDLVCLAAVKPHKHLMDGQ